MNCILCMEPIEVQHRLGQAHSECLLRSVLGGIGHHEDHQRWCVQENDPDGGRSFRQSAIEVELLVEKLGMEAVLKKATDMS